MNQHNITVEARFCPELIERVLRITRHRGFSLCSMNMDMTENNHIRLMLTVTSSRPLDFLSKQLTKLVDVVNVHISHHKQHKQHNY